MSPSRGWLHTLIIHRFVMKITIYSDIFHMIFMVECVGFDFLHILERAAIVKLKSRRLKSHWL
jgi:hypothetical protein